MHLQEILIKVFKEQDWENDLKIVIQNYGVNEFHVPSGHLKTLGTQTGYPIGILIWVVVKINDQTGFRFILLSRRCQHGLPN